MSISPPYDVDVLVKTLIGHGFKEESTGPSYHDEAGNPVGGWTRYLHPRPTGYRGVVINHGGSHLVVVDLDHQLGTNWTASFSSTAPSEAILATTSVE